MAQTLPQFRYHPEPLLTGAVVPSAVVCARCGRPRGFVYTGCVFGEGDLHNRLCPWCIADGSAATSLGASFASTRGLEDAGLGRAILDEIGLRTPGYRAWQQEEWQAHCGDACEFHGDASVDDVVNAPGVTRAAWRQEWEMTDEDWSDITAHYRPGGDPAFYKFVCRHCGVMLLGWDCS